jgi:hypothetical protein
MNVGGRAVTRSHFIQLASAEDWGSVLVCRHGVIHLRWGNITVRLPHEVFSRLVRLVGQGSNLASSIPLRDGELGVAIEEGGYRVAVDFLELVLTAEAFLAFLMLVKDAHCTLEEVMARDDWQEEPQSLTFEDDAQELLRPHRFSLN